jgi:hypothetical protein
MNAKKILWYIINKKKMNVRNFFRTHFDKKEEEKKGKKHFS